jgi:outer membrane protein TolC
LLDAASAMPILIGKRPTVFGNEEGMTKQARTSLSWCAAILCGATFGCAAPQTPNLPIVRNISSKAKHETIPNHSAGVRQASLGFDAGTVIQAGGNGIGDHPLGGAKELSAEMVVEQVLARNPSLAQMAAAWEAASARYPQVTSLDDPMLLGMLGPGTFGSNNFNTAYMVRFSQKLPFPGKLGLRGDRATANASAAQLDIEDMRLQLIEAAQTAFFEYFLVHRALEVNQESLKLWQNAKQDAKSRYETGKVDQQDVLQADVEIGREQERRLSLQEMRQIAIARINTLMHLLPDSPLPPPPQEIKLLSKLPQAQELRAAALDNRPDLRAIADRIKADQAALALAYKDFYPDFDVMAGYDAFWQEKELRPQIGLQMNLPIYKGRRHGAVAEAQAQIAQRRAELARQVDQVNYQVQEAFEKASKSEKSVLLYKETILPAAELNAKAARSAYVTGKIPALSRIEAERNLVNLRDRYYEALADYFRRRATLDRVVGATITRTGSGRAEFGRPE